MIKIRFFGRLREEIGKSYVEFYCEKCRLRDLLNKILINDKPLTKYITDESGNIRRDIKVLVNGRDVKKLGGLNIIINDNDSILIGPPLTAGGMVDITHKPFSYRYAEAEGYIYLKKNTINLIKEGKVEKGDVYEAVKMAAINAVKSTPHILVYCHPIKITDVNVSMVTYNDKIKVTVTVKSIEQTGVEMEALTGVMAGLLTIWDMVKKYEKDISGNYPNTWISDVKVIKKEKRNVNN